MDIKIIKELEKLAKQYKKEANDSETVAEARGYLKAVKDLKNIIKK